MVSIPTLHNTILNVIDRPITMTRLSAVKNHLFSIPVLICFLIIILLTSGCQFKPGAKNNLNTVALFADGGAYSASALLLKSALERRIDTPQPETVFSLEHTAWDAFQSRADYANILMVGTLDGNGPVTKFIGGMLDADARQGVENGDFWIFRKQNPWCRNQLLCIIIASNAAELRKRIQSGGDEIFATLNESALVRLKETLYRVNENTGLAGELRDKYGFTLRIQHDYSLAEEDMDNRFLRLRRLYPDRWLTISWTRSDTITDSLIAAERRRIGGLFADPVFIYDDYNRWYRDEDARPFDLILRGLWGTERTIGGGPFFICALQAQNERMVYFIDGAVFAPDREKVPLLQQLEVMARTFQPPG